MGCSRRYSPASAQESAKESRDIPDFANDLYSADMDKFYDALSRIQRTRENCEWAVPRLIEVLKHKDKQVVLNVIETLRRLGRDAKQAVLPISRFLLSDDPRLQYASADAIRTIGADYRLLDTIKLSLRRSSAKEGHEQINGILLGILLNLDSLSFDDIDLLFAFLSSKSVELRGRAIALFGKLHTKNDDALKAITEALSKDPVDLVRSSAANSLGNIGISAPFVLNSLKKSVKEDTSRLARSYAALALVKLGDRDVGLNYILAEIKKEDNKIDYRISLAAELAAYAADSESMIPDGLKELPGYLRSKRRWEEEKLKAGKNK